MKNWLDGDTTQHENASENFECLAVDESDVAIVSELPGTISSENPVIDHTCTDIGLLLQNGREFLRNVSDDQKLKIINKIPDNSIVYNY